MTRSKIGKVLTAGKKRWIEETGDWRERRLLLSRFLYLFGSFIYLEILLHLLLYRSFEPGLCLLYIISYTLTYALIALLLSGLFSSRAANFAVAVAIQIVVALCFGAQYIYFVFFRTPLMMYSVFNAAQVSEFAGEAFNMIFRHLPQLLLFFLPLALLIWRGRRWWRRVRPMLWLTGLVFAAVLFVVACGLLRLSGDTPTSAYNLYYNEYNTYSAQQNLGMMTAMRLDIKRMLFGFHPLNQPQAVDPDQLIEDAQAVSSIAYPPNVLDIDFERLIDEETDSRRLAMHQYFAALSPGLQNEYTGRFAGCNLIFVVAEGFYYPLLDLDLYPTLRRLATEGFQFTNFYNPLWNVSTSDGEYVALTGLLPETGVWSFSRSAENYLPFTLGRQFTALGYDKVMAYHNHNYTYYNRNLSHPNLGYDFKAVNHGLDIGKSWPESDLEMAQASVDDYIDAANFHVYYLTVSGHLEYNFYGNNMAMRHEQEVADLPYSDAVRAYIACNLELEHMMSYLLQRLEEAGQLENTVIALVSDHYPYGLSEAAIDELVGHQVERNFELYKNTFILWKPGVEHQVVDEPMCSLDILPTISNLFGLPYDSRLLMGRDVFSQTPALVAFANRSWISEYGSYNSITGKISGELSAPYVQAVNELVAGKFIYSAQILDTDYYRQAL
ncbi:MAG: LTA synthase family protein, partial [Clostridia bacterium]|nr:LTA synthase family protein [Clostridia bacterium]